MQNKHREVVTGHSVHMVGSQSQDLGWGKAGSPVFHGFSLMVSQVLGLTVRERTRVQRPRRKERREGQRGQPRVFFKISDRCETPDLGNSESTTWVNPQKCTHRCTRLKMLRAKREPSSNMPEGKVLYLAKGKGGNCSRVTVEMCDTLVGRRM